MSSNEGFRHRRRALIAGVLLALLGAQPSASADTNSSPGVAGSPPTPATRTEREAPGRVLSLRDALELSLERSPELASFSWEIRARQARTLQAGLLPNPTFSAEVENIGGSGPNSGTEAIETTLLLSQLIELGGKRDKRRSVSAFDTEVATREYEAARLGVIAEITAAFVDALAQQESVRLAADQIQLAEEVLRAVQAEVQAGAVSLAEVARAEVEITNQQIARRLRDRSMRAAYVRLATTWGASEPNFSALAGDLNAVSPIPPEAELVERMASTPELARWRAELRKRRAAIEFEDARGTPDLTLGLGPRHFSDTNDWALVVGVQLPLPLFDRNQGARQESRNRLTKSREQQRSAELRLRRELARSYQGLISAYEELLALRNEAIPIAERAYAATKRARSQGAVRFTEVLDTQRSLFALRARLLSTLASYHRSRAQTEALIGGPLSREKDSQK